MNCYIVIPALKISGGIREALNLGDSLNENGCKTGIVSMWQNEHPMPTSMGVTFLSGWVAKIKFALFQLPLLMFNFSQFAYTKEPNSSKFIFTHYVTLPFAFFVPRSSRFYFVQDLEWEFVKRPLIKKALRWFIVWFYRRGSIITANQYLTSSLSDLGLNVQLETPIWAQADFLCNEAQPRDIDFVMVLRNGDHKRLNLYLSFIDANKKNDKYRIAVITPEDSIADAVQDAVSLVLRRPSLEEMRNLYSRSKCFILLSEHEGFGLPPLEAMGAGCVPICRDCGGVRAFMGNDLLKNNLIPLSRSVDEILQYGDYLLSNPSTLQSLSESAKEVFTSGLNTKNSGKLLSDIFRE